MAVEAYSFVAKPYTSRITLIIGGTEEELYEQFRSRRLPKNEALWFSNYCVTEGRKSHAVTLISGHNPGRLFIFFPKPIDLNKPEHVDTIAHEVMHCVVAIMKRAAVRITDASEESFAYLTGRIMQDIWIRLTNRSRKPRPDWAIQPLG